MLPLAHVFPRPVTAGPRLSCFLIVGCGVLALAPPRILHAPLWQLLRCCKRYPWVLTFTRAPACLFPVSHFPVEVFELGLWISNAGLCCPIGVSIERAVGRLVHASTYASTATAVARVRVLIRSRGFLFTHRLCTAPQPANVLDAFGLLHFWGPCVFLSWPRSPLLPPRVCGGFLWNEVLIPPLPRFVTFPR